MVLEAPSDGRYPPRGRRDPYRAGSEEAHRVAATGVALPAGQAKRQGDTAPNIYSMTINIRTGMLYKLSFHLRFVLGYSVAETASEMNRDQRAVRQLQFRAVGRLSRSMRDSWT